MNTSQLAERLMQEQRSINYAEALRTINLVIDLMKEGIKKEGQLKLKGLGKFELVEYEERKGSHPKTKEEIIIRSRVRVKFKYSQKFIKELET